MSMATVEYWDENEFNFFETLEDEDKLLYLYDLMIGEFAYLPIHEEMERLDAEERELSRLMKAAEELEGEVDDNYDFERDRNEVKIEFVKGDDRDIINIYGPTLDLLVKVANDLQMNGMILMNRKVEFTKYEPWQVILTFDVIGNTPPFSVN